MQGIFRQFAINETPCNFLIFGRVPAEQLKAAPAPPFARCLGRVAVLEVRKFTVSKTKGFRPDSSQYRVSACVAGDPGYHAECHTFDRGETLKAPGMNPRDAVLLGSGPKIALGVFE